MLPLDTQQRTVLVSEICSTWVQTEKPVGHCGLPCGYLGSALFRGRLLFLTLQQESECSQLVFPGPLSPSSPDCFQAALL